MTFAKRSQLTVALALSAGLAFLTQPVLAAPVLSDFAIFGTTSVSTGNNIVAPGSIGSGGAVTVASGGKVGSVYSGGTVTTGNNAVVSGDIVASGNILLGAGSRTGTVHGGANIVSGNNAVISGAAQAGGTVTLGNGSSAGSKVNGAAAPTPLATPFNMPNASVFTAAGANQAVSGVFNLAAGTYGNLTTASNAVLNLSAGVYYFDSFTVGNGAQINLDLGLGDIVINIVGGLSTGNNVNFVLSGGDPFDVLFEVHGASTIGSGNVWVGTLFAPDAAVSFGNNALINGAVYGDVVTIGSGAAVNYAPSNILFAAYNQPTEPTDPADVSEPGLLGLVGLGLLALGATRRRRVA